MAGPAIFLDKDGTLIEDVPYNVDPARIRLAAGAATALAALHAAGFPLVIVSNQSGVARGYFPEAALAAVEGRLRELLGQCGVPLAGFHYCPHLPDGAVPAYAVACVCRKPAPGLLRAAAAAGGFDLARSWMIGDRLDDVEAGRRAGCQTILIAPAAPPVAEAPLRRPHHVAGDLTEAARIVLASGWREPPDAIPPF